MKTKKLVLALVISCVVSVNAFAYTFLGSQSNTPAQNRAYLDALITYVNANPYVSETISFPAGIIEIELPQTQYGSDGQFGAFHTHNKVFRGSDQGTQLKWIIKVDGNGKPDTTYPLHSFWLFASDCTNIEVASLQFNTNLPDYGSTPGYYSAPDGCHIKTFGSGVTIHYCMFFHAPSFAISIHENSYGTVIDHCAIWESHADGVHAVGGNVIQISNLDIDGLADDAIAIIPDGYGTYTYDYPHNVTVTQNTINDVHGRGIVVLGADHIEVTHNDIQYTAATGIEINDLKEGNGGSPNVRTNDVSVSYNTVYYAGYVSQNSSPWTINNTAHGMWIANCDMVSGNKVHANVIQNVKFDGIIHGSSTMTGSNVEPVISAVYISLFPSYLTDDGNDSNDASYNYVDNANTGGNSGGGSYVTY